MPSPSLTSQIAEVERELAMRRSVYARERDPKKQDRNVLHMAHMEAVLATLLFVKKNEAKIRAAVAEGAQ